MPIYVLARISPVVVAATVAAGGVPAKRGDADVSFTADQRARHGDRPPSVPQGVRGIRPVGARRAVAAALEHLNTVVQPHLDDEEQKVVPLAAVTLTQQEWDAMGKSGISKIPRKKRAIAFGMMLDALDGEERAYMLKTVPAPMRLLLPFMIERPWRKYAATLRTGT